MTDYYAHTSVGKKEKLIDHLLKTADFAECFSSEFSCGKIGRQIGLLHDVGKRTRYFQEVLNHERKGINHAIVGAIVYNQKIKTGFYVPSKTLAKIICMCIACHHSSLHKQGDYLIPDSFDNLGSIITEDSSKINALSSYAEYREILKYVEDEKLLIQISKQDYLEFKGMSNSGKMFFARMLFSCLVDADYTATANFENELYYEESEGLFLDPEKRLWELEQYRKEKFSDSVYSEMNCLRETVFNNAKEYKENGPGVYTMTAPTGTGKTLALMAFALQQAKHNNQKRIFIVLPFLSIITQNAAVYKSIFGNDIVLEDDSQTEYTEKTRLLSDRWSAPIIVTTSVRFFETLFRIKTTDIRRLHQVANSVVVFDEAQTLPLGITDVTMELMQELAKNYNTTILLSTATQPAYEFREGLAKLPFATKEIIPDVSELFGRYSVLKNTEVIFYLDEKWDYERLACYFEKCAQVLFVFNTVKKAQEMFQLLKEKGKKDLFYLSSSLCPIHRLEILDELKNRLDCGLNAWLISTQCIEAGVDIDFPCGAREIAPYTSIVQTAGRINRNGKADGKMIVFEMDNQGKEGYPGDDYRNESMLTLSMARKEKINLNNPLCVKKYFQQLFCGTSNGEKDYPDVVRAVEEEDYEALSDVYKIIDERDKDIVVVPYSDFFEVIKQRLEEKNWVITKKDMKEMQAITVSARLKDEAKVFCIQLSLATKHGPELTNWYLLKDSSLYSDEYGFTQNKILDSAFFI